VYNDQLYKEAQQSEQACIIVADRKILKEKETLMNPQTAIATMWIISVSIAVAMLYVHAVRYAKYNSTSR